MKRKGTLIVMNDKGLHTRPATELVRCAQGFECDVFLSYRGISVNAKSLLEILMLSAAQNAKVEIEAQGEDADEAVNALEKLARNRFNIRY